MNTNAINEAQAILNNKAVMQFLREEAIAKVVDDMQAEGSSITVEGVKQLMMSKFSKQAEFISTRVDLYIASGVVGCMMVQA